LSVGHSHTTDQLPVGRLDDIHNFTAVGFDKSSIDVVRCDCLHGNLPDLWKSNQGVESWMLQTDCQPRMCSNTPLNDQLLLEVNEHDRDAALTVSIF